MLTVHHLATSQSERIVWLCEELELPYLLKRYERDANRAAPPAYRALHPVGTAPIISEGALVLPESGAIIEYILAKYGNGRLQAKPDDLEFAPYVFWMHFANGSLMPAELVQLVVSHIPGGGENPLAKLLTARTDRNYALVEERLGQVPYLAGENFTAADIINFFALTTMRAFSRRDFGAFPNIRAYIERVGERPAYRRAMAKAEPGVKLPLE